MYPRGHGDFGTPGMRRRGLLIVDMMIGIGKIEMVRVVGIGIIGMIGMGTIEMIGMVKIGMIGPSARLG